MVKSIRFIRAIARIFRPKAMGIFVEISELTKFEYLTSVSWSQGMEDLALLHVFKDQKNGNNVRSPPGYSADEHFHQQPI